MLQVSEPGEDVASRDEIHALGQVQVTLLPVGVDSVWSSVFSLDLNRVDGDAWVCELLWRVRCQLLLVHLENGVDVSVPLVEDWITHGCGGISHYSERLQVTMIGIVRVGNDDVSHVVQVSVELAVGRQDRGFHHVAENIDTANVIQRHAIARLINNGTLADGFQESFTPAFQVADVQTNLIDLAIQVLKNGAGNSRRPRSRSHKRVEFREISLGNGSAEVAQATNTRQAVAEAFKVVTGDDLLVHVVEEFTSAILVDDSSVAGLEWVHQMPMPMMEINAHVFSEVPQSMFFLKIRSGVVSSVNQGEVSQNV